MKKLLILLLLVIFSSIAYADIGVTILDPDDDSVLERGALEDWITVTVKIDKAPQRCWYEYLDLGETDFPCDVGMNTFDIYVNYFGEHYIDVYVDGKEGGNFRDGSTFDVIPSQGFVEKQEAVEKEVEITPNLETIFCFGESECAWDNDQFLQVALFAMILIVMVLAYFEYNKGDKN